jgi:transposase
MSAGLKVTRSDHTAAALRRVASKKRDAAQVRRLLALALVLEGVSRAEAATRNGMDRQTLRDWVRRYNELGIDGLKSGSSSGRKPLLSGVQKAELLALAVKGPDPEKDTVVRWRCVDLRDEVRRRFDVTVHENTIGAWLREMKLTRLQPRPFHPKKDPAAQEAYKKRMARPVRKRFLQSDLSSLRQRIRPMGTALAKMEIRAPRSS